MSGPLIAIPISEDIDTSNENKVKRARTTKEGIFSRIISYFSSPPQTLTKMDAFTEDTKLSFSGVVSIDTHTQVNTEISINDKVSLECHSYEILFKSFHMKAIYEFIDNHKTQIVNAYIVNKKDGNLLLIFVVFFLSAKEDSTSEKEKYVLKNVERIHTKISRYLDKTGFFKTLRQSESKGLGGILNSLVGMKRVDHGKCGQYIIDIAISESRYIHDSVVNTRAGVNSRQSRKLLFESIVLRDVDLFSYYHLWTEGILDNWRIKIRTGFKENVTLFTRHK